MWKTKIFETVKRKKKLIKKSESRSSNRKRKSVPKNEDIDAITFK